MYCQNPLVPVVFEGAKLKLKMLEVMSLRIGSWQSCRIASLGNCLYVGRATIGILLFYFTTEFLNGA